MGNKSSKANQLNYNAADWTQIEKASIYQVMRSNTGKLAHLYHFSIKSDRKLEEQVEIYHKRRNSANWVQVIGAKIQQKGFGFCGSQQNATVLTERIPILLNGIGKMNQEQSNIVLYSSLKGLNEISKFVVPASLNDKMIGFNQQGQTKIWINQNFGMNYPAHYNKSNLLNQRQVVNNLLDAIKDNTTLNSDYVGVLRNTNNIQNALNFIRTNSGVAQNILYSSRINISKYLTTTTSIIQPIQQVNLFEQTKPIIQNSIINTTYVQPQVTSKPIQQHISTSNYSHYTKPITTVTQSHYKRPTVNFTHSPVVGMTQTFGNNVTYGNTMNIGSYIKPVHGVSSTLRY